MTELEFFFHKAQLLHAVYGHVVISKSGPVVSCVAVERAERKPCPSTAGLTGPFVL